MKRLQILLVPLLLAACSALSGVEQFIGGDGPYAFTLDLTDSTAVAWDIDLYTRVDARECPAEIALEVAWTAPSDAVFTETVYLPLQAGGSSFSWEAYAPYRSGIVPPERGIWTLTVTVPQPPEGLRGMGLVQRRKL